MYQCTAKEQLRSVDLALHPQLGLAPEPGNLEDTGMETNSRPGLLRQFFFSNTTTTFWKLCEYRNIKARSEKISPHNTQYRSSKQLTFYRTSASIPALFIYNENDLLAVQHCTSMIVLKILLT